MKCLLSVCLIALGVAAAVAANDPGQVPALRKGVRVQMAVSKTAIPMADADDENAWVVTVAENGDTYFGVHKLRLDELADVMKATPRNRKQNLYIKVDARAPFARVRGVLDVAKDSMFATPVLLTAQPTSHAQGVMVPPMGLEVSLSDKSGDGITVEVAGPEQHAEVRMDGKVVRASELQGALREALQGRTEKVVRLQESGGTRFEDIVHVIDVCHGAGAQVLISAPSV